MTAYDELKKKYDSLLEKLEKWEDEFPGQEPEDAAKQLKIVNKKAADANRELREAKEELEKLRNAPPKSTGISSEMLEKVYQEHQEKVNKLNEEIKVKENEIQEFKKQLETKDREVWTLTNEKTKKKDFGESVAREAHDYITSGATTGVELGLKTFPVLGPAIGGILGYIAGDIGALIHAGNYTLERCMEEGNEFYKVTLKSGAEVAIQAGSGAVSLIKRGMDSGDKVGEELKEFTENMANLGVGEFENLRKGAQEFATDAMNTTANTLENWRNGWENVTKQFMGDTKSVVNESIGVAKEAVKGGLGVKYGEFEVGVNMGKGNVLEAKVENKDETIADLRKQLEEKQKLIDTLQENQKKFQDDQAKMGLMSLQVAQQLASNK